MRPAPRNKEFGGLFLKVSRFVALEAETRSPDNDECKQLLLTVSDTLKSLNGSEARTEEHFRINPILVS